MLKLCKNTFLNSNKIVYSDLTNYRDENRLFSNI